MSRIIRPASPALIDSSDQSWGMVQSAILQVLAAGGAAGGNPNGFDPNYKAAAIVLSNNNLTMDDPTQAQGMARALGQKTTGTGFLEWTITSAPSGSYFSLGIGNSSITTSQANLGFDANSAGYDGGPGRSGGNMVYNSGTTVSAANNIVTGDIVGMLVNKTSKQITCYVNGVAQTSALTFGITGNIYAVAIAYKGTVTLNVGDTAFAYTMPGGAVAWKNMT